jgi:hypothetical protein
MNDVKIIRNDRGLDFKRLEQFVRMIYNKSNNKIREIGKKENEISKNVKAEAFKHYKIDVDILAIQSIDEEIKKLKSQKEQLEDNIRKFTKTEKSYYGSYDEAMEGSKVYEFIEKEAKCFKDKENLTNKIAREFETKIWLSRDLEEAIDLFKRYSEEIENIEIK